MLKQSKSANIEDIENNKDMDAGSDSSDSQNKSLSIKFEGIDHDAQYKFIENEIHERKKPNYLDNMSRQDHKSHLTDNKSQIFKSPLQTLNGSYLEELA